MLYCFCTHSAYNTLFSKTAECLNHLTDLLILIKTNVPLYKQLQLHGKQTDLMLCYVMLTQHQPLTPSGRQLVTLTAFHIFKCILISYNINICLFIFYMQFTVFEAQSTHTVSTQLTLVWLSVTARHLQLRFLGVMLPWYFFSQIGLCRRFFTVEQQWNLSSQPNLPIKQNPPTLYHQKVHVSRCFSCDIF